MIIKTGSNPPISGFVNESGTAVELKISIADALTVTILEAMQIEEDHHSN